MSPNNEVAVAHSVRHNWREVAIVYASKDREWATYIEQEIGAMGLRVRHVLFDGADLPPKSYWSQMAKRRKKGFFRVLLLVSEHLLPLYATQRWVELWRKAIFTRAVGCVRVVYLDSIPLERGPGATVPLLPRIDLVGKSDEQARLALIEGILDINPLLQFPSLYPVLKPPVSVDPKSDERMVHATIEIDIPFSQISPTLAEIKDRLLLFAAMNTDHLGADPRFSGTNYSIRFGTTPRVRATAKLRALLRAYIADSMARVEDGAVRHDSEETLSDMRAEIALLLELLGLHTWCDRMTKAIDEFAQKREVGRQDHEGFAALALWVESQESVEHLKQALSVYE